MGAAGLQVAQPHQHMAKRPALRHEITGREVGGHARAVQLVVHAAVIADAVVVVGVGCRVGTILA